LSIIVLCITVRPKGRRRDAQAATRNTITQKAPRISGAHSRINQSTAAEPDAVIGALGIAGGDTDAVVAAIPMTMGKLLVLRACFSGVAGRDKVREMPREA
jgi:hypothetical protein